MLKKIPNDWRWVKLVDIAKWGSGGTPLSSNSAYYDGDIPWLIIGDLTDEYIYRAKRNITALGLLNSSAKIVDVDSVLIAMYGSIGKLGINKIPVATNQAIAFTEKLNDNTNNKFLFYFLSHIKGELFSLAKGGTQQNISQTVLKNIDFPLPPKPIQNQIVSKIEELFSELDKGIENLQLAQQQLKLYRQSVLKWAFEGKLTNANVKEGGLPKGWKIVSIIDLAEKNKHALKAGPFGSALKKEFYTKDGYKIYGQEQVISGDPFLGNYYIDEQKYQELSSCKIKPFDILISLVGTVGKVLLLPDNCISGIINPRLIKISLDNKMYLPKFFKYYFESSFVKSFYGAETRGTTMDVLNLGIIKTIPFPLCSINEQLLIINEIENRLSFTDKMEEGITQSLQQAEGLRQSILKKAFEGKLVESEVIKIKETHTTKAVSFERKVLASKIIHLLCDDSHFGLTKFQKVLYLVENFAEVEYETNFIQERAGPYDREFTTAFRKEMKEKDWVQEEQKRSITKFIPGENIGSLIVNYAKHFRSKSKRIVFVIKNLQDKSTHEAELIATLYAVWNNRLIKKKPFKMKDLIEDFFNWSAKKSEEFHEEEIEMNYRWMKDVGLVPSGFGSIIEIDSKVG